MSNSSKKYFWLKLKDDFFTTREVKKLRRIAGGDTYTIIYLKLQLLSIKKEGLIQFEGTESNLIEQLSIELDEEENNVEVTLAFLKANKLIEQLTQDEYLLNKVPESIGSETGAAERMRRMRAKADGNIEELEEKRNIVTQELQLVTNGYTEIEKRRDREDIYTPVIEYLNDKAKKQYRTTTAKTKTLIQARINEGFTISDFKKVVDNKVAEWIGTDMDKFLRPETLFGTKFEGYLNEDSKTIKNNDKPDPYAGMEVY